MLPSHGYRFRLINGPFPSRFRSKLSALIFQPLRAKHPAPHPALTSLVNIAQGKELRVLLLLTANFYPYADLD